MRAGPTRGKEWVLAGRLVTKRTGVRVLPYDLPKATTRVKGPVWVPACLVFLADPLTRVVGGTQVIREDTKRHTYRRCRAGRARSATSVGAARRLDRSATSVGATAQAGQKRHQCA